MKRTAELRRLFKQPAALIMIDVDRFKSVNEGMGHPAGDALLKALGDRLARTFPRRGDLVARYGGDEFVVVLKDAGPDQVRVLARRVVDAARALRVAHQGRQLATTLSVGISDLAEGDTPESWLARADAALYAAKEAGRDRCMGASTPSQRG